MNFHECFLQLGRSKEKLANPSACTNAWGIALELWKKPIVTGVPWRALYRRRKPGSFTMRRQALQTPEARVRLWVRGGRCSRIVRYDADHGCGVIGLALRFLFHGKLSEFTFFYFWPVLLKHGHPPPICLTMRLVNAKILKGVAKFTFKKSSPPSPRLDVVHRNMSAPIVGRQHQGQLKKRRKGATQRYREKRKIENPIGRDGWRRRTCEECGAIEVGREIG